jgi:ATP-binding cassette, subfamily B, bacterial PglK
MLNNIQDLNKILSKRQKIYLVFMYLSAFLMSLLETIGVGSLVGFIVLLSEPIAMVEKIPFDSIKLILLELNSKTITIYASILIILVFLFKNIIFFIIFYFDSKINKNLNVDLSKRVFSSFLKNPYIFHTLNSPVSLINTISPMTHRAVNYIFSWLVFAREALTIIFLLGALIIVEDTRFYSFIFIFFGTISYVFNYFSKKKIKLIGNKTNFYEEETLGYLHRAFSYIKLIKLFNTNEYWIRKFFIRKNRLLDNQMLSQLLSKIPKIILEIVAVTTVILIFLSLSLLDGRNIEDMLPIYSFITLIIIRCIPAFNNLNVSLNAINYTKPSFEKIIKLLIEDKNKPSVVSSLDNKTKISVEKIEAKNLSFSYNKNSKILENISFKISKGQIIGINGKTGSGKSTLVDLILGLLKPDSGQILVNDQKINENSFENISIGYVTQDTYISDDTIHENIAFSVDNENIDQNKINKAKKNANLDNFINDLPDQGDTYIGESGVRISGGQKQRIGLARALYNNPEILILDEATSALDYETEEKIINEIIKLKEKKIIIMIAHRLNTLKNCDQIITIKDKKIV